MATSKDFLNYLIEQLKGISDITFRPMMGEYLLYYRGKLIGDVCDNCVFLKPVASAKKLLPDVDMRPPYNGAKDMIVLEELENVQLIQTLFETMYAELPEPKQKTKRI